MNANGVLALVGDRMRLWLLTRCGSIVVAMSCPACSVEGETSSPTAPFGSGTFGRWTTDAWGLPAYDYIIDERTAAAAKRPELKGDTAAWHQVGNDHIVANAYNHGYTQFWTQARHAQWLNQYDESSRQYSGGFGYLRVNGRVVTTLAADRTDQEMVERRFGIGYFRHTLTEKEVTVEEYVYAPCGDFPLLCHDVTLTNRTSMSLEVVWWEYWGVNPVAIVSKDESLDVTYVKRGLKAIRYDRDNQMLSVQQSPLGDDASPLFLFAAALEAPVAGYETSTDQFFGKGSRARPFAVCENQASNDLGGGKRDGDRSDVLFALQSPVTLKPGETVRLRYAYGCAHEADMKRLLRPDSIRSLSLDQSELNWKTWLPDADFGREYSWLARELKWAAYAVRSASVFEEIPGKHVITQGGYYQYLKGAQIAFRDPLQHMLPIVFSSPELAREVLVYSAQQQSGFDGVIPYGRAGMGHAIGAGSVSDLEVWLMLASMEYVNATRDFRFLDTMVKWADGGDAPFWEHLKLGYKHQEGFATGMHDLYVAGKSGDWSDCMPQTTGITESTLVVAQLAYVYPRLAEIAEARDDRDFAERLRRRGEALKQALRREWVAAGWYSRGYAAHRQLGSGAIFGEPQPWAILSGVPTGEQAALMVTNIRRFLTGVGAPDFLHGPSKIGSSMSPAANDPLVKEIENNGQVGDNNAVYVGGTWYSINGTLVWALGKLDGTVPNAKEYAWDELLRNTLAYHANAFPDHWDGVTTVDDVCWSWFSSHPDWCGLTAQVFDGYRGQIAHQPAWLWFNLLKMAGMDAATKGFVINRLLPLPRYTVRLPNFGIRVKQASIDGYCRSESPDGFEIRLRLSQGERVAGVWVDGMAAGHKTENEYAVLQLSGADVGTLRHWTVAFDLEAGAALLKSPLTPMEQKDPGCARSDHP